jgi:hypothetical protein
MNLNLLPVLKQTNMFTSFSVKSLLKPIKLVGTFIREWLESARYYVFESVLISICVFRMIWVARTY